ncbi:MAG: RIO1 family regulatory kinase/ATPase [Candidatus Shapirobacteria bacterium]|jgi:RIO kinase 1
MSTRSQSVEIWSKKYPSIRLVKNIKSGKEADCLLVDIKNQLYCLKTYKNRSLSTTQGNSLYLAGKYFRNPSQKKSVAKGNKFGKDLIRRLWTKREFYLLKKFYELGANVPGVFDYNTDSILMEYLGDINLPAPLLKDVDLDQNQLNQVFDQIIDSIKTFYTCGIVHGDLSEFNILWWQDSPYIIDFPQAIDVRHNPNANEFLLRDIGNICKFFGKNNLEEIFTDVVR